MILLYIIIAGIIGGLLSLLVAGLFVAGLPQRWLPRMVAFATGALLGAATLTVLPEAFETGEDPRMLFTVLLGGLLALFLMERASLWRHHHHADGEHHGHGGHEHEAAHSHGHDGHSHGHHHHGHSHVVGQDTVMSILIGDGFHNFVDGVVIAAAFLTDPLLGWTTTAAVVAHEIPQEAGDFMLLRAAGFSNLKALLYNGASSLASVAGGIVGYFALASAQPLLPYALCLAAASFLYIAVADLIPMLRRERERHVAAWQVGCLLAGIGVMVVTGLFHHH
ncbi:MAG: ZIP family metal transporter [Moraxellaceae bacterium]|nr:ZIP family metal transporter [Moraxellaceae bacterium]